MLYPWLIPAPGSAPRQLSSWPDSSSASPAAASVDSASPTRASSGSNERPSRRRVACARCRRLKEKCVWVGMQDECERCGIKGSSCSGPVPLRNRPRQLSPDVASRSAVPSPYRTAAGRPRAFGPSSSEASLNALARAKLLRTELVQLYHDMWPSQPLGLSPNSIRDLFDGPRDDAHKVLLSVCTATGARSSTNSEILAQAGPAFKVVDHLTDSEPESGGFAQWGLLRQQACFTLGARALEQATALLEGTPTFRRLKVGLLTSGLSTMVSGDSRGKRSFNALAIRVWRGVLADPSTTGEERAALVGPIGLILLLRELKNMIASGGEFEFSPPEQALIHSNNSFDFTREWFGLPDCSSSRKLVVFDEHAIKTESHRFHLALLAAFAPLLSPTALSNFNAATAQALRQLWAANDWAISRVEPKVAQIGALSASQVVVLHEWQGRWRPANARDHATCLVAELATDSYDVDGFVYERLRDALDSGGLVGVGVDVEEIVTEARERCRLAVKDVARSMRRWATLERKHAVLSRIFHYLGHVKGWVQLALGRLGDAAGPKTEEAELSLAEIELLVWGLRIGSFSQGSLGEPLRELERGLEELRQAEAAKSMSELDFDLEQYLVGLEVDGEVGALTPPLA